MICALIGSALAQTPDHLSADEVKTAVSAKPDSGFVLIADAGFTTPSLCNAQMPGIFIDTPAGWLNALSQGARQQFLPFNPKPEDTLRALTIISHGCSSGTAAGPVCQSITRAALLSDIHGEKVVEAIESSQVTQSWQNGFGASAACSNLLSKFSMADLQKVRDKKGEFLVATFGGAQLLKIYTVKEKHLKKLGM
jgi:hypothetical protein